MGYSEFIKGDRRSSFLASIRWISSSLPPFPESARSETISGCSMPVGIDMDCSSMAVVAVIPPRLVAGKDNNFLDVSTLFFIPLTPMEDVGVRRPFAVGFGFAGAGSEFRTTVVFGNDWAFDALGAADFGRAFVC